VDPGDNDHLGYERVLLPYDFSRCRLPARFSEDGCSLIPTIRDVDKGYRLVIAESAVYVLPKRVGQA